MNVSSKSELERLIAADEIDQMISDGLEDIERGETINGEEAFRQLRAFSTERRRQQV